MKFSANANLESLSATVYLWCLLLCMHGCSDDVTQCVWVCAATPAVSNDRKKKKKSVKNLSLTSCSTSVRVLCASHSFWHATNFIVSKWNCELVIYLVVYALLLPPRVVYDIEIGVVVAADATAATAAFRQSNTKNSSWRLNTMYVCAVQSYRSPTKNQRHTLTHTHTYQISESITRAFQYGCDHTACTSRNKNRWRILKLTLARWLIKIGHETNGHPSGNFQQTSNTYHTHTNTHSSGMLKLLSNIGDALKANAAEHQKTRVCWELISSLSKWNTSTRCIRIGNESAYFSRLLVGFLS